MNTVALQAKIQNIAVVADRIARTTEIRDQLVEDEKTAHFFCSSAIWGRSPFFVASAFRPVWPGRCI